MNQGYNEVLTCGDRVYYVDHPRAKGAHRWRAGLIIKRKPDCDYSSGPRASHGYDIYDVENCTTVSRTRAHIRKYKHTKVERELLKTAHEHVEAMRKEFHKHSNRDFQNPDMDPPVEFSMEDYDKAVQDPEYIRRISEPVAVTPTAPTAAQPESTPEPVIKQEPMEEGPITELPQEEPIQKKPRKSREESNLETGLNGPK